jgi:hypothetical protein
MAIEAIEAALAGTGEKICAWDHESHGASLAVYAVGEAGARRLATAPIAADLREATAAALRARGVRIGGCHCGHEFVWVADVRGCTVWSREAVVFAASRFAVGLVTTVVSYLGEDYVRRGVRLVRVGMEDLVVAEEDDDIARLDPFYNWDNLLLSDAHWVSACGRDVADWLGVPHRDEAFGPR